MRLSLYTITLIASLAVLVWMGDPYQGAHAGVPVQQPLETTSPISSPVTGRSLATVTYEEEQINVRAGPGTDYAIVGVLFAGQQVPALGRSIGGDWVQISFPEVSGGVAWVYAYLVTLSGSVPVVEPPATPTPAVTPTIDPTLAAQFIQEIPPTRLPTFTPPPELVLPTIPPRPDPRPTSGLPVVVVMIGLAVVGLFGALLSFIRGR